MSTSVDMGKVGAPPNIQCKEHAALSHLLIHPLCAHQERIKKIIALVASALTLFIPCICNFIYVEVSKKRMLFLVACVKSTEGFAPINEEALRFVRQALQDHPTIGSTYIGGSRWFNKYQSTNPAIPKLITLEDLYYEKLEKTVREAGQVPNPWESEKVQKVADGLIKISYVISQLTLHDMPSFTKYLARWWRTQRTSCEALYEQDSYAYRTFFSVPCLYHQTIRSGYLYKANPREQPQYLYPGPSSVWDPHPDLTPEQIAIYNEYAAKFYKEGTLQSSWRSLYNDFCKAAATVRKDDKYGSHDTRFIKWTREDTEDASFRITPDTLPT